MQFCSSSDNCFSSKNFNVDQNCIFEENKSGNHQISERKSVEQNCISTNSPSRERGGRGPKIIPPCSIKGLSFESVYHKYDLTFLDIRYRLYWISFPYESRSCHGELKSKKVLPLFRYRLDRSG